MVIDMFRKFIGDEDSSELISKLSPDFKQIFSTLYQNNPKNIKEIIKRLYSISENYKMLSVTDKHIYWKLISNRYSLDELESAHRKLKQVVHDFKNLTSDKNGHKQVNLDVYYYFYPEADPAKNPDPKPERNPAKYADAIILTTSHAREYETLKSERDRGVNNDAARILENYNIIGNFRFGLNSYQILEEAKLWNDIVKNYSDISEEVIFQILRDLNILPSNLKPHLDAYKKLQTLDNFPKDLITERDKKLASPELRSSYISLLIELEAKFDLRKKEFAEVYKDPRTGISFNCAEFAKIALNHTTPDIVKREILSVKALFELLKNNKVSERIKDMILNVIENGRNYEYFLFHIQQEISMLESSSISNSEREKIRRAFPNLSISEQSNIVSSLKNIKDLPTSVRTVVEKFSSKGFINAPEVYEEAKILKNLIELCYNPVTDANLRLYLNLLIEYNLRPSEIQRRLGL